MPVPLCVFTIKELEHNKERSILTSVCIVFLQSTALTFAARGVEGLVGLDEDVARMEGHQDDFLQLLVRELSLQVHVLLHVGIFTKVLSRDLEPETPAMCDEQTKGITCKISILCHVRKIFQTR